MVKRVQIPMSALTGGGGPVGRRGGSARAGVCRCGGRRALGGAAAASVGVGGRGVAAGAASALGLGEGRVGAHLGDCIGRRGRGGLPGGMVGARPHRRCCRRGAVLYRL